MRPSAILKELIAGDRLIVAPGTFDGLSARLVELAGFPAVYASGGAISRAACMPDLNLLSLKETVEQVERIADAVSLPVIADADAGNGGALNVYRTVTMLRRAGAAACHLEDQVFPKRCGHYDDKRVVTASVMRERLRAAKDAADDMVLIARTDALATEPFEACMERAHSYMDCGADMIFVEAPRSVEEIEAIARSLPFAKLINMFAGGKTPLMPASRLEALGYSVMIVPSDLQRAAIAAMVKTLDAIKTDGSSEAVQSELVSFTEREGIVGTASYQERDRRYQETGSRL